MWRRWLQCGCLMESRSKSHSNSQPSPHHKSNKSSPHAFGLAPTTPNREKYKQSESVVKFQFSHASKDEGNESEYEKNSVDLSVFPPSPQVTSQPETAPVNPSDAVCEAIDESQERDATNEPSQQIDE